MKKLPVGSFFQWCTDAPTDTYIAVARYRNCRENRKVAATRKCGAFFQWRIKAPTDTYIAGVPVSKHWHKL